MEIFHHVPNLTGNCLIIDSQSFRFTCGCCLLFAALKTIGNDFVFGFIQAVDGEKVSQKDFFVITKNWKQ